MVSVSAVVWGYDKAVVKVLTSMQSNGAEAHVTGDAVCDCVDVLHVCVHACV